MKKASHLIIFLLLGVFTEAQISPAGSNINISKLIAYEKDSSFFIDWATDGIVKTNYWEVQTSIDGKAFSTIAFVLGPDPAKPGEQFGYKGKISDQKPAVFYRIVHISSSGIKQPGNIIKLVKLDSLSLINPDIKHKIPVLL
ncbi:MAG: hypothetical protein ABI741_07745 [Ferruginibacter sp.]